MSQAFFRHPRDMAPLFKFIAMLGFIAAAYCSSSLVMISSVIVLEACIAIVCSVFRTFRITFLALLFGALTLCLFQIFTISEGTTVFHFIPFLRIGPVTDVGLSSCLTMALRMIASVGAIPLVLSMTSQTQVVSLVSGNFRLPGAYAVMLITALRFIPTFGERMRQVLQAEAARGYNVESGNPFRKIGVILRLSLPLLISCARDVDTLALSIETRGFNPRNTSRPRCIAPTSGDALVLFLCLGMQTAIVLADRIMLA